MTTPCRPAFKASIPGSKRVSFWAAVDLAMLAVAAAVLLFLVLEAL